MKDDYLSIATISEPFGDGQRVTAVAIEFGAIISNASLSPASFCAKNRTVTTIYANTVPETAVSGRDGRYVIVGLDWHDQDARTVIQQIHEVYPRPKYVLPNGQEFHGPHGLYDRRDAVTATIWQAQDIQTIDGTIITADGFETSSTSEINLGSDDFEFFHLKDMDYALFVPRDYDPSRKYPLVLFIHDAGAVGHSPRITLEQGVGAVIWAKPDEQAKHPCFVLAPQHAKELPITNDDYQATEDLETIKAMCDEVAGRYRIDMDRIYTTGQSMGFMCSVELMYRYPDYFGGALLVAGHWDVARFATLGDKNVWVFESEFDGMGFPSATSAAARIEAGGTPIGRYTWDGSAPIEELNSLIRAAAQDGHNFRLTVFPQDSVLRKGLWDESHSGCHPATWELVYRIEAIRDWLFTCRRTTRC